MVAAAAAAIVAIPTAAFAHHNAYMVVKTYSSHQIGADQCARAASVIKLNPFSDWADPSCDDDGSKIRLVAKHVG